MELSEVVNTQYAFPVGVVLICAVLVFAFGFKSAEQPAFAQLTYTGDDRKPAGKKRKIKDKKVQSNGHVTNVNEDNAETKHKTNDAVGSKLSVNKSVVKQAKDNRHDAEKSPAKDVPNKAVVKQQKQNKQETSPAKEQQNKPGAKETVNKSVASKAQKENKKEAAEPQTKQLKEKKQDILEKSPSKDTNKLSTSKQSKGRGKENEVEEIKNQKNQKNLAKLKAEEKPLDFDDGEWEQAVSRKDKKNRKKDDPVAVDDAGSENIVKKETSSPSKKKKAKGSDVGNAEAVPAEETKIMNNNEKTPEEKPSDKEQKAEVEIPEKEAVAIVEVTVTPEIKSGEESGIVPETAVKSKKKSKKKSATKSAEPEIPVATETTIETQEVTQPAPVVEIKVAHSKQSEVKEEVQPDAESVPKTEPGSTVAFDELGDVWKEAKTQKKSKKKARKDQ